MTDTQIAELKKTALQIAMQYDKDYTAMMQKAQEIFNFLTSGL